MVFKIISVGSIPATLVITLFTNYNKYFKKRVKPAKKSFNKYKFENLNEFRRKKYKNIINNFTKWPLLSTHSKSAIHLNLLSSDYAHLKNGLFYHNLHLLNIYVYHNYCETLARNIDVYNIKLFYGNKNLNEHYDYDLSGIILNLTNNNGTSNSSVGGLRFSCTVSSSFLGTSNNPSTNLISSTQLPYINGYFDSWLLLRLLKISTHYLNRKCLLGIYASSSSYFNVNNHYFLSLKNVRVFNTLLLRNLLTLTDCTKFNSSKLFNLSKFEFITAPGKSTNFIKGEKNTLLKSIRLKPFKMNFNILNKYTKYIKRSIYIRKGKRFFYGKLIKRTSYAFFKRRYIFKKLNLNKFRQRRRIRIKRILSNSFKKSKRFLKLMNLKIRFYAKVDFVHKNFDFNKKIASVKGINKVPVYLTHSSASKKSVLFDSKFNKTSASRGLVFFKNSFHNNLRNNILLPFNKCLNFFNFVFFVKLNYLYSFDNTLKFLHKGLSTNLIPASQNFNYKVYKNLYSNRLNLSFRENITPWMYNNIIRFMEFHSGRKVMLDIYSFMYQSIDFNYVVLYKFWLARFSYYERRLGHRFFLEEALHILHMSFSYQDSKLLSSWLKSMIKRISFWKTRFIFRFIRYLFNNYFRFLFKELGIKGLKIKLKGKISVAGNSRKRCILYRVGKTSHSTLDLKVVHTTDTIVTFTGVMGFQIWIFY